MKQATLKVAGTAALGVAIAAIAAGSASAAAGGLPIGGLGDTGALTGTATSTLGKTPVGAPVTQTVGTLNPSSGTQAPANAEAPAPAEGTMGEAPAAAQGANRSALPLGPVQGAASKLPVAGALGSLAPVGGTLPIGG